MGAEDLVLNGHDVAVIEYHITDVFETPFALARQSYYWVTALPTVYFDGVIENSGGNGGTSLYEEYLPLYQQRKAILSDFTIDIQGVNSQLQDYVVIVSVEKVAENNSSNLKLFFTLTESEIEWVWMGQPTVNYCQHMAIPEDDGTTLDFSQSEVLDFTFPFTVDPEWNLEYCEVVVWIQNMSSKEVYQAAKRSLSEFGDFPNHDPMVKHVYTPVTLCNNVFEPGIEVVNLGTAELTSLDFIYQIDDEPEQTYNWSGNIPFSETSIVSLPEINLPVINSSNFNVKLANPNGQNDEFPFNNTMSSTILEAENVSSPVTVVLKLDAFPEQTSWELWNSAGTVLYSGGNYTQPNVFVTESLDLGDIDCYSFKIYDSNGDGLTGTGIYKLMYGTTIFQTGKEFGFQDDVEFGIGLTEIELSMIDKEFSLFPNPASNSINIHSTGRIHDIEVYNHIGQLVYETSARTNILHVDVSNFEKGIYIFKVETEQGLTVKQVMIQ